MPHDSGGNVPLQCELQRRQASHCIVGKGIGEDAGAGRNDEIGAFHGADIRARRREILMQGERALDGNERAEAGWPVATNVFLNAVERLAYRARKQLIGPAKQPVAEKCDSTHKRDRLNTRTVERQRLWCRGQRRD